MGKGDTGKMGHLVKDMHIIPSYWHLYDRLHFFLAIFTSVFVKYVHIFFSGLDISFSVRYGENGPPSGESGPLNKLNITFISDKQK